MTADARRRHRPSRKQEILGAALEQIAANGFANTTLSGVASRAGITVTAVYYHFESKLTLLEDLVRDIGADILAALSDEPTGQAQLGDGFVSLFDAFAKWLEDHPLEARLYFIRSVGVAQEVEVLRRVWTNEVALAASDMVLQVSTHLDVLTARVLGLSLPTLLEEYAAIRLGAEVPLSQARSRALRAAVVEMGSRLNQFSVLTSQVVSQPSGGM